RVFDGVPASLPALAAARKLSARAAAAGYDFPDRRMQFDKLREELAELSRELFDRDAPEAVPAGIDGPVRPDDPIADPARRDRAEAELGDVLFVLANIGRRWGLDPEQALRRSNRKFADRVRYIERRLRESADDGGGPRELGDVSLAEMEALYQEGKRRERGNG
ncbi:MAG: nucleoside triphosphate pyrophosphohydrolase, partial [Planctomycetota bacterium]